MKPLQQSAESSGKIWEKWKTRLRGWRNHFVQLSGQNDSESWFKFGRMNAFMKTNRTKSAADCTIDGTTSVATIG